LFLYFLFPFHAYPLLTAGKMNHISHFALLSKKNDRYAYSHRLGTETQDWLQEKALSSELPL